jgi:hypothetical protein
MQLEIKKCNHLHFYSSTFLNFLLIDSASNFDQFTRGNLNDHFHHQFEHCGTPFTLFWLVWQIKNP